MSGENQEPENPQEQIRNRIRGLKQIEAKRLNPHPKNWRKHPMMQQAAMQDLLREIGYADALLVRQLEGGRYEIIDGHLRAELTPDQQVPCLVLDVNEEEALKILATHDPIATMARADSDLLKSVLDDIGSQDTSLTDLLSHIAEQHNLVDVPISTPDSEWTDMPEFTHEDLTGVRRIVMHFKTEEAAQDFARLLGQEITEKTRFMWYPPEERAIVHDKEFVSDEEYEDDDEDTYDDNFDSEYDEEE